MATKGNDQKYCQECAAVINIKAEICPHCGVRQPGLPIANGSTGSRTKVTAGLFALFLGGLGVHKFYLGQVGWGVVYIIFCWTFIPAIIGFFEGLVLLSMSEADFQNKYP